MKPPGRVGCFIAVLAALALPFAAEAQPPAKIPRIGVLMPLAPPPAPNPDIDGFRQGLRELGYVEGQTIILEYRWAEGMTKRAAEILPELIRLPVDVIVVAGGGYALAAKQISSTVPIVMATGSGAFELGLIESLARPGGNVTGLYMMAPELSAKRVELLKETIARLTRIAVLMAPARGKPFEDRFLPPTEAAARALGLALQPRGVNGPAELDAAFREATKGHAGAVILLQHPFFAIHKARIAELALKSRLPMMAGEPGFVEAGGLMTYGPSIPDLWRRAATYVHKILKGAKPANLPVEQPTKFELAVNLRTAKALGLTLPPSILIRADRVIE